jgi:hypothetical protein
MKSERKAALPNEWRLYAPANIQSGSHKQSSQKETLGSAWNHVVLRGFITKAQQTPIPNSASLHLGKQSEQQAIHSGNQCKVTCPQVQVVESHTHKFKLTD